tara:strand:- start:2012 stop:2752 length:741 start_codon:yes stop_codon:yes gene_type:complete
MKKFLYLILIITLIGADATADISKIKVDGRLRYFSTLVDNLGKDYDSARPGPVLDLHFSYPVSPKFVIKNFNYFVNYNDTTSGDEEMNIEINQRLAFMYINKGRVIAPYLKMVNHDENPSKQVDNSHKGIYLEQFFNKDKSVSLDYREELSDGSVIGKIRYGQRVFDLRYKNKNLFLFFDKPVHLNLGYTEGVNLRGVKSLIFTSDITKNLEVTVKYIDNIGKGPIGSTNLAQNRNFLVSEIGFKF